MASCKKTNRAIADPKFTANETQKPHPWVQACSLITNDEISAIQATKILDAKSSENWDGRYVTSQCYYSSGEPNKSVSFALTQKDQNNPGKKIEGVGEEAFWEGSRFGGALYVLKADVILRVSVGGPDKEDTKIEKSKTLADKAVRRLP